MPGSAAEKPSQGEALAIGPGRVLDSGEKVEVPVSVGDTVVFGQYAGSNTIKVDGEELLIPVKAIFLERFQVNNYIFF